MNIENDESQATRLCGGSLSVRTLHGQADPGGNCTIPTRSHWAIWRLSRHLGALSS